MARISEAGLERLKREVPLVRLIQSQGHELKKRGKDWVMHCVFHDESTPSLSVSEEKNLYHCFGCGAAGSVIDWVMKTQGVSLPHAVQLLRNDAPLENTEKVGVTRSHTRRLPFFSCRLFGFCCVRWSSSTTPISSNPPKHWPI